MEEPPSWNLCTVSAQSSIYSLTRTPKSYQHILLLVYYKMFDIKGPLKIRNPIYSNNPYIGRVDANDIPPPHNASSLAGHICAKQKRGFGIDWEYGDAYSTELFEAISSPKAFDQQKPLSLLSTDRPGSRPQDPLLLKIVDKGMLKQRYLSATLLTRVICLRVFPGKVIKQLLVCNHCDHGNVVILYCYSESLISDSQHSTTPVSFITFRVVPSAIAYLMPSAYPYPEECRRMIWSHMIYDLLYISFLSVCISCVLRLRSHSLVNLVCAKLS